MSRAQTCEIDLHVHILSSSDFDSILLPIQEGHMYICLCCAYSSLPYASSTSESPVSGLHHSHPASDTFARQQRQKVKLGREAVQEQARIHGGLLALRSLMRKYEFRHDDEEGTGRPAVVNASFPVLLHIFQVDPGWQLQF